MVQVQQQSLTPVEEAETENIVVGECKQRSQDDVDESEMGGAFGHNHLRAQRRVAVDVLDVVGERGVGVVEERAVLNSSGKPLDVNVFMDRATLETAASATEEAQLWIRPEAAMPDPTTEKFILPGYR